MFSTFDADVAPVELEIFMFRLVTALNNWFSSDPSKALVGNRSLLVSLINLKKIKRLQPNFTLTVYNINRLFAVMMLLAAKFFEDDVISNLYRSDVTSIDLEELNELEALLHSCTRKQS